MTERITACPDCDGPDVREPPLKATEDFRCVDCGAMFDEPVRRRRKYGRNALAGRLQRDVDADEILPDGGRSHSLRAQQVDALGRIEDCLERIAVAQERQANAQEAIAGILMVEFDYKEDRPGYTVEALYEEALYHGTGGERRHG